MKTALLILVSFLVACTSGPPLRNYDLPEAQVELKGTPFFPQSRYQCGPAALATVLVANGVEVTPQTLAPHVYIPELKGSLQSEMIAVTRRHGHLPYVLEPDLQTLLAEVAAGTPVLVMQNLGIGILPKWHYAVVIGYDSASDSLLLRSGTDERLRMSRRRFEASWSRAQHWAMVVAPLDQPPATAQYAGWLWAASAFEELEQAGAAEQAYKAATRRWPDQVLTWQALANASYALNDLPAAEAALRHAIRLAPSAATYNNLAHVLQQQGCPAAAAAELDLAKTMPDADRFAEVLARTEAAINSSVEGDTSHCISAR